MKKNSVMVGCLTIFGLLAAPNLANADEATNINRTNLKPVTKSAVVKEEFTLQAGQSKTFSFGYTNTKDFSSKILVKYIVDNPQKDYFVFKNDYTVRYWGDWAERISRISNSNNVLLDYKYSPATDPSMKDITRYGTDTFTFINYSVKPMKFKVGFSSGMHIKALPCVDYNDIDFSLD